MNPQSLTRANANAAVEELRRRVARERRSEAAATARPRRIETIRVSRPLGEARLACVAVVKTLLVLVVLAVAVALVDHAQTSPPPANVAMPLVAGQPLR